MLAPERTAYGNLSPKMTKKNTYHIVMIFCEWQKEIVELEAGKLHRFVAKSMGQPFLAYLRMLYGLHICYTNKQTKVLT